MAGVLGSTHRTASLSPDVNDPALRKATFAQLVAVYRESIHALIKGYQVGILAIQRAGILLWHRSSVIK